MREHLSASAGLTSPSFSGLEYSISNAFLKVGEKVLVSFRKWYLAQLRDLKQSISGIYLNSRS